MGWGVDFDVTLFLSKENYDENIAQVQDTIDEELALVEKLKQELMIIGSSRPVDLFKESEDLIFDLRIKINEILEDIRNYEIHIYKLTLYKDYLQEKELPLD